MSNNTVLVLAPHTDDGELGCGATIAKYMAEGRHVIYAAFSACAQSLPAGVPPDTLVHECYAATNVLGIQRAQVILFDFTVRAFPASRQQILESMVQLNRNFSPGTVLLPAQNDVHQDHQVIYAEGIRAFKNTTVLGYELPWNNTRFQPTYFEQIAVEGIDLKCKALAEYRSQQHQYYMNPDFIRSLSVVRGIQCKAAFAEAFEVYKMIGP
jgi:LmbE family N-acetylglucosaminyl deacetylase